MSPRTCLECRRKQIFSALKNLNNLGQLEVCSTGIDEFTVDDGTVFDHSANVNVATFGGSIGTINVDGSRLPVRRTPWHRGRRHHQWRKDHTGWFDWRR